MIRVAFVGSSGHSETAFQHIYESLEPAAEAVAYCKAYPGEDLKDLSYKAGEYLLLKMSVYEDLDLMLDEVKPDVLVVDGRYGEHGAHAEAALKRGISVFTDKPMALDEEQLVHLHDVAKEHGCTFWSMQTMRFYPDIVTAKQLANEKTIGRLRMITVQKSYSFGRRPAWMGDAKLYGGTLPWVGIHGIDMIRFFSERAILHGTAMKSAAHNRGLGDFETTAVMSLQLEDDVLAQVQVDMHLPEHYIPQGENRIRIVGTEGIVEVTNGKVLLTNAEVYRQEMPLQSVPMGLFTCFLFDLQARQSKQGVFAFVNETVKRQMTRGLSNRECLYLNRVVLRLNEAAECGERIQMVDIFEKERQEKEALRQLAEQEAEKALAEQERSMRERLERARKKRQEKKD